MRTGYLVFFLLCLLGTAQVLPCHAQKLLPDTLYIDFKGDSVLALNQVGITAISDLRKEDPHFIGFTTRKAWLVIPVDREIHTTDSLASAIQRNIPVFSSQGRNYALELDKFEIIDKKDKFSSSLLLVADIGVFEWVEDSLKRMGTLYYDYPYAPLSGKESYVESAQKLLYEWHTDFKLDLMTLQSVSKGYGSELAPNFITDPKVNSLYLNTKVGAFAGINWYGFQGEIFFSRPETKRQDRYSAGLVRYINRDAYESFALGRKASHRFWRRNENLVLDIDANILMGFCKWRNPQEYDPTLYQLFDFEVSSIQSLIYQPLNRNSITFRLGLIENVSYVIGMIPGFEIGLYTEIGFKF